MTGPQLAWTVEQACEVFARGGLPVEPARLEGIIRELRKTPGGAVRLKPVGAMPVGERGGRGKALYPARVLMELHRDIAPWVTDPAAGQPPAQALAW